jgi:hypothetical protein
VATYDAPNLLGRWDDLHSLTLRDLATGSRRGVSIAMLSRDEHGARPAGRRPGNATVGGDMIKRNYAALTGVIGAVVGLGLAVQVRAGADKVAFPESYAKGAHYLTVDKPSKQVHEFYAAPAAIDAAHKGEPMPDGTVITGVHYNAKLDADGNPAKGPDGRFVKADLRGYAVMEKRKGWGADYAADKRNGEWEYRYFSSDKSPNEKVNLGACFECHLPQAKQDFVHSYDKLKTATH